MSVSSTTEFRQYIELALRGLTNKLGPAHLDFAGEQALNELGWSLPISDQVKSYWLIQRGKRHALDILRTESAFKFKYKQINLNQRFEHLDRLIKVLDETFLKALESDPNLFGATNVSDLFGTYIGNGIVYDQHGNDITRLMNDFGIDNDGYRERYI